MLNVVVNAARQGFLDRWPPGRPIARRALSLAGGSRQPGRRCRTRQSDVRRAPRARRVVFQPAPSSTSWIAIFDRSGSGVANPHRRHPHHPIVASRGRSAAAGPAAGAPAKAAQEPASGRERPRSRWRRCLARLWSPCLDLARTEACNARYVFGAEVSEQHRALFQSAMDVGARYIRTYLGRELPPTTIYAHTDLETMIITSANTRPRSLADSRALWGWRTAVRRSRSYFATMRTGPP